MSMFSIRNERSRVSVDGVPEEAGNTTITTGTMRRLARASLVSLALAATLIPSPADAVTGYRITGTGGIGANVRNAPWPAHSGVRYNIPEGQGIDIRCQYEGQVVNGSRIWDRLQDGAWVSDYYVSTPVYNGYSAGIPKCNEVAADWARSKIGSTAWEWMCDNFVAQAHGFRNSGYNTAKDHWNHLASMGRTYGGTPTAVGSLVFFGANANNGQAGHVAIYVGNGQVISNGIGGRIGYTTISGLSASAPYLGWSLGDVPRGSGQSW
ncbi:MAG: NlpC/P60 family protein [Acidimicrobiales bacterium]